MGAKIVDHGPNEWRIEKSVKHLTDLFCGRTQGITIFTKHFKLEVW